MVIKEKVTRKISSGHGQRNPLRRGNSGPASSVNPPVEKITLEQVLGVSATSNNSLAYDAQTETALYTAGCVCVLYNIKRSKQTHIKNEAKKPLTCAAFSKDGKYVVTGESGHQPMVRVWEVAPNQNTSSGTGNAQQTANMGTQQLSELKGHKFGISTVGFSPNAKVVVSVGFSHDSNVFVWNWKAGEQIAGNKVSSRVFGMVYNDAGTFFLTVGIRFIKYWYFDSNNEQALNKLNPCENRAAILDQHRNTTFKAVVSGTGKFAHLMFCLSNDGKLFTFGESRRVERWLDLKVNDAFALYVTQEHLLCGCSDGVVRIFDPATLSHLVNLPKPHPLGVNLSTCTSPSCMVSVLPSSQFPDCIGVIADCDTKKVITLYRDKSMYIWDITNLQRIGKYRSYLFHSACVCAIEVYPKELTNSEHKMYLPRGTFFTGSSDNTIKIWNLNTIDPQNGIKRNIYSKELINQIYTDEDFSWMRSKKGNAFSDNYNGLTALAINPRGDSIASGDRSGNLRVHDLTNMECAELVLIEAHDAEILALSFTNPDGYWHYLATASRDRLIHIFDIRDDYQLVQTLSDHSAIVTSVKFVERPTDAQLTFLTCSADKSVRFRTGSKNANNKLQFQTYQHVQEKSTFNDMEIPPSRTKVTTGCQDRCIRTYELSTGKCTASFKSGGADDSGMIVNVTLDPSGTFIAAAGSDKCIFIHDFNTGDRVASLYGHSEMITGMKFTNDCKRLISISGDGCIFVWRLQNDVVKNIKSRMKGQGIVPEMSADTPVAVHKTCSTPLSPHSEHLTPLQLNYNEIDPILYPPSSSDTQVSGSESDNCTSVSQSTDLSETPKRTPDSRRKKWGVPDSMAILDSMVLNDSTSGTPTTELKPEDVKLTDVMTPTPTNTAPTPGSMPAGTRTAPDGGEEPVTPPHSALVTPPHSALVPIPVDEEEEEDSSAEDTPQEVIFAPPKVTSPTATNKRLSHVFDVNVEDPLKGLAASDASDRETETEKDRPEDEEEDILQMKFTAEFDMDTSTDEELAGHTLSPRSAARQSMSKKFYKSNSPDKNNRDGSCKSPRDNSKFPRSPTPRSRASPRQKASLPTTRSDINTAVEKVRQVVEEKIVHKKREKFSTLRSVMSVVREMGAVPRDPADPLATHPATRTATRTPPTTDSEEFKIHRRPSNRALRNHDVTSRDSCPGSGVQSSLSSIDNWNSDTDSGSSKYMSTNSRTTGASSDISSKATPAEKPTKTKKGGLFGSKSKDTEKESKNKEEKSAKKSKEERKNKEERKKDKAARKGKDSIKDGKDPLLELQANFKLALAQHDVLLEGPSSESRDAELDRHNHTFRLLLLQLQSRLHTPNTESADGALPTTTEGAEAYAARCAELCADKILDLVQQKLHAKH